MNSKFVVSHLDQQIGPFDEQELKMKWAAGEILPIDYVFDDAKQDWILLAERFPWAAKPIVKENTVSGPPPVKEGHIMKRTPPPAPIQQPRSVPATPAGTTVVSAANIAEGIKLSEPLKLEPLKAQLFQPIKVTEVMKLADTNYMPAKPAAVAAAVATPSAAPEPEPEPEPEPLPAATAAATTAAAAPAIEQRPIAHAPVTVDMPAGARVNMVNGVGEVELTPMKPGEVKLLLQQSNSSTMLKMTEPLKIHVKASEPVHVEWTVPAQQTVGQDVEVVIRAFDDRGLVCAHYNDEYLMMIRGPVSQDVVVKIQEGKALVMLNHIKSEAWNMSLQYTGSRKLKMPDNKSLEWVPGAAARLVLDGNPEFLAGDPMKVQVRAVDAYGNTARTFQGTVVLEVKAS